jgi:hypothetical protein
MLYIFELFSISAENDRRKLGVMQYDAASRPFANDLAKALIKYVMVRDQKIDLCVIKDKTGVVVFQKYRE